jgi:hypothetical protein
MIAHVLWLTLQPVFAASQWEAAGWDTHHIILLHQAGASKSLRHRKSWSRFPPVGEELVASSVGLYLGSLT